MGDLLILGARGQVGRALASLAADRGISHRALGRADCDVTDRKAVGRAIERASFVVNCAAHTAVDAAETDIAKAYGVNALACEHIASACAEADAGLLHLSTDHVFDGVVPQPWREEDPARPLNVYGRSKLAGEIAVRSRLTSHIILRTSWIFSAHGNNFVKTLRSRAREQRSLPVIGDQVGGPTEAADVAAAILSIVAQVEKSSSASWGTYHFSGAPAVSRFEFAQAVLSDSDVRLIPVAAREYGAAARRPSNSVLDCGRLAQVFGIPQPDWRPALARVLAALGGRR